MLERLKQNRFTLNDFRDQLAQVKNMGSIQELAGMLPGVDAKALAGAQINEKDLAHIEAILQSMTPDERENPSLLNSSRKKRIAQGSGTSVVEINRMLKQYEVTKQLTKQMSGSKRRRGMKFPGLPF